MLWKTHDLKKCYLFSAWSSKSTSSLLMHYHKVFSDVIMVVAITGMTTSNTKVFCCGSQLDGPKSNVVTVKHNSFA